MRNFKLDMHVHTAEVSRCGRVKAANLVKLYKEAGYGGVVITDHYHQDFFAQQDNLSWEEKVGKYLTGYYKAYQVGKELNLNVILGMEIRFIDSPNDYLVYGITPDFLREHPRLYQLGLEKFRELVTDKDILIYQAHPYRGGLTRAESDLLDGVEVFNGNPRHKSSNKLAYQFAQENNLRMISGSDFHELDDLAVGGVILSEEVADSQKLVEVLEEEIVELMTNDDVSY